MATKATGWHTVTTLRWGYVFDMLGISNALKAAFLWVQFEGGRSAEEIRKFWQSSEHPSINKQEWSAEEVERLKAIAATHGHLEWHLVAEELGVRTRPANLESLGGHGLLGLGWSAVSCYIVWYTQF